MIHKVREALATLRDWAVNYEPAVAATLVAAVFQMLVGLGVAVGDWPAKVDAVLAFLAVTSTLLAGREIRKRAFSKATRDRQVQDARSRGWFDGRHARRVS